MSGSDFSRVRQLFEQALDHPEGERAAWLEQACAGDAALQGQVLDLLAGHSDSDADAFLQPPDPQAVAEHLTAAGALRSGDRIDGYEIVGVLASGGMGTVYEARQQNPDRRVALKVLRASLAGSAARGRFAYETEVLGRLRHESIAQIHAAGVAEVGGHELPWFAMELVEDAAGIVEYGVRGGLGLPERLQLFCQACDAIDFGHQRGVIHRDVKAGNVLVDGGGHLKVIDFGVARAVAGDAADTQHTRAGDVVGTLRSMSPEQLRGDGSAVDVRTDVYALGALLYELVTGRPPHDLTGRSFTEIVQVVSEQDPVRPSALPEAEGTPLPPDLDWIVLKALEKDPEDRYPSAHELAADVRRLLADEPVLAGSPSASYRVRKFVRRHRMGVLAAAVMLLLLLGGITGTTLGWLRSETQRVEAEQARDEAEDARAEAEERRQEAVDAHAQAAAEAEKSGAVVEYMIDTLGLPDPGVSGADLRVLDALRLSEGKISTAFSALPEVEAMLRATLGRLYFNLAAWSDAERHLRVALQLRSDRLGPDHPDTLITRARLGATLSGAGRLHEAGAHLTVAREGLEQHYSETHPEVIECLAALALLRQREDDLEQSDALYRLVIDRATFRYGPDSRAALVAHGNLGGLLIEGGRISDARAILEPTLERMRVALGDDDPMTTMVMGNLAMIYVTNHEMVAGAALLSESIERRKKVLPANHPDLLLAMGNLGSLYYLNSEEEKALEIYADLVSLRDEVFPPLDPYSIKFRANYATVLYQVGDEQALRREVAALVALGIGENAANSSQVGALAKLADALRGWGYSDLSVDLYEQMFLGYARLMPGHPNVTMSRDRLAAGLRALGRDDEAAAVEAMGSG